MTFSRLILEAGTGLMKEVDMEALDMIVEAYDEVERTEVMEHFDMADDGRDLRFDFEDVTDAALS